MATVVRMPAPPKTDKGRATRERIVSAAADLVRANGVRATSIDEVIDAAGVSKSQLYHYFDDKADLIRSVVDHTKTVLIDLQQAFLERLDDWAGVSAWFDAIVADETSRHTRGGCPLGSLVPELADSDELARNVLAHAFDEWQNHLAQGLRRMQACGELRGDADPERLATATMASLQGGLLLSQVRRDPGQLRTALDSAMAHLQLHRRGTDPLRMLGPAGVRRPDSTKPAVHFRAPTEAINTDR
jgi:TetR/AcrR family transcriptional repressor of nem operon